MMTKLRNVVLLSLLAPAAIAWGNPVPDTVVEAFRTLVATTAREGACPDPEGLTAGFGTYGLGLCSATELEYIEVRFTLFAPVLAASQRPNYMPRHDIQRFYRFHAASADRVLMLKSLREWLTVKVENAPVRGGEQVHVTAEALGAEVLAARAVAAGMLADWGDREAVAAIGALAAADSVSADLRWHFRRAELRLSQPCAMTFLKANPDGTVERCATVSDVAEARLAAGGWEGGKTLRVLTRDELGRLWSSLVDTRACKDTQWLASSYSVLLAFANGVRAGLSPTERGHVVYTDNTTLYEPSRITLESVALWEEITALLRSQPGVEFP